ncbi:hypothetical protein JW835_05815 [bacterium]|nr:hypothetical protein [bacterium]
MRYQLNPDFSYCVDIRDIKLISRRDNTRICLPYPQAAVFDLLLKGYSQQAMERMMAKIALVTESHAAGLIRDTLDDLMEKKVIKI